MQSRILGFFGGGIFLMTALCAQAAQETSAPSTREREVTALRSETTTQEAAGRPELHQRDPRYRLCKDDVVDLSFPLTPEYNQTVSVQPDGFITLRGVGDIHAEGQTIPELNRAIRAAYTKVLHEPIINIELKDFEKPYFIAGGELGRPGRYELRGDTTVTQAVAIAGGFTESSKHSEVWLFRRVSDEWAEAQKLDVKKMLSHGDLREDVHLRPGDMLYVPKNTLGKIRRFIPVATVGTYLNPNAF